MKKLKPNSQTEGSPPLLRTSIINRTDIRLIKSLLHDVFTAPTRSYGAWVGGWDVANDNTVTRNE